MTSAVWSEFSRSYIDKLNGPRDPKVDSFITDLSGVFDEFPIPNLVNWDNLGQELTIIRNLEDEESITPSELETLEGMLDAVQKRQARIPYEKALIQFQSRMKSFADTKFNKTDTATIEAPMEYVYSGVQNVVGNSVGVGSTAADSSNAEARQHLDFLNHQIEEDSLAKFPQGTEKRFHSLEQSSCVEGIQGSIKTLCKTARELYTFENRYALASQAEHARLSSA